MIARGASIHRRVLGDTDPCYDAHPYLKGTTGDLWVALFLVSLGFPAATESGVIHLLDIQITAIRYIAH